MAAPQPRPPVRPAGKPDMSTVMANLGNLFAMDRDGKLAPTQVLQLRQLISVQTRQIILTTLLKNQPNPLANLAPHLDPSVSYNGNPPLISREAFQINVQNATAEAHRIQNNILPLNKLKEMLAISPDDRQKLFTTDPTMKLKFHTSVTWYSKGAAGFPLPGRPLSQPASGPSTPRPSPSQPVRPPPQQHQQQQQQQNQQNHAQSQNSNQQAGQAAGASQAAQTAAPQVKQEEPPQPPAPVRPPVPAQPVEPEPARRKRKMAEYLKESGPGLEYEVGVTDVWGEILDSFVQEAGRGAARLAKHRGSDRVAVKDLAFFLNETYGITVPGFNAQVPAHVHAVPEDRRRKAVAPRAARLGKAKDDDA